LLLHVSLWYVLSFLYDARERSNFHVFACGYATTPALLEQMIAISSWMDLVLVAENFWPSILLHWSICLSLWQHHTCWLQVLCSNSKPGSVSLVFVVNKNSLGKNSRKKMGLYFKI
jgi:hypothetical protein